MRGLGWGFLRVGVMRAGMTRERRGRKKGRTERRMRMGEKKKRIERRILQN